MSLFVFFDCFVVDVAKKIHKFDTDTLKICLTNVAPLASNTVFGTPAEIAASGGYPAGGLDTGSNTYTESGGIATLAPGLATVTFTATTGFGPFRWAPLYNFTAAAKNLIGYWDYGSSTSLAAGKPFDINLGAALLTIQGFSV